MLLLLLFHITFIITIFIIITIIIITIIIITIILVLLLDHPLLPQLRHSQNFFTTGLVSHDNGYPYLTCKAYNGQVFLVFLTTCLDTLVNQIGDDQEINLALSTSKAMCVSFDRIERYGRYLTNSEARDLHDALIGTVSGYQKLALLCIRKGISRWKFIPKLHCVVHLAEDALAYKYNCKYYHCFKDEDNIGLLKKLAVMVAKPLMEWRILLRWQLRLVSWIPGTGEW